jgi:hypothetical protein
MKIMGNKIISKITKNSLMQFEIIRRIVVEKENM